MRCDNVLEEALRDAVAFANEHGVDDGRIQEANEILDGVDASEILERDEEGIIDIDKVKYERGVEEPRRAELGAPKPYDSCSTFTDLQKKMIDQTVVQRIEFTDDALDLEELDEIIDNEESLDVDMRV
jgi:hypothetical protein